MINEEALKRIEELKKLYEYNWGVPLEWDCRLVPMTQEDLVVVLERIVETGESVLVGWNKCFLGQIGRSAFELPRRDGGIAPYVNKR